MKTVLPSLAALVCLLVSPSRVVGGAVESSRVQTTVTVERNIITADSNVTFAGYVRGETITVTLNYSATCLVVFNGLTLWQPIPFAPPRIVAGDIANISGTPQAGRPETNGSVTFDIRFSTLQRTPTGTQSGLARLNLVLGVDKDCNLHTGDPDGVDRSVNIRVQISVSTES
jgi:hypothetical protein